MLLAVLGCGDSCRNHVHAGSVYSTYCTLHGRFKGAAHSFFHQTELCAHKCTLFCSMQSSCCVKAVVSALHEVLLIRPILKLVSTSFSTAFLMLCEE